MIELSNLTFGYSKKKPLFNNLNLNLEAGHIYGLLGKNGSGKSTLLKNIAGLVLPQHGKCTLNGQNASARKPSFLQELFFIPEELHMPALSATQFASRTAHFYPNFNEGQLRHILSEFDVSPEQMLNKLSFGQQKKMMIAFGMATNTSLLIMDEPTNGLDIPSKGQFRKIVASALTENRCIIISTHQVRDLDSLIDQVLILHNQDIILNKSLDAITERLHFTSTSAANGHAALYKEEHLMGINTILENTGQDFSKVDLELLFNAIISDNSSIIHLLK